MPKTRLLMNVYIGLILLFILAPILVIIPASFGASGLFTLPPTAFTFQHYMKVFQDSRLLSSLWLKRRFIKY